MTRVMGGVCRRLMVLAVFFAGIVVFLVPANPAHASVTSVSGLAFGYYTNVGLGGGPQSVRGYGQTIPPGDAASASPSVALPSSGGNLTQTDPDGAVGVYGPAHIFENHGPITVHTEGTTGGTGSVTSSASVDDIEPNDPFMAPSPDGQVRSTCTANESGLSGSTTITGGRLALLDPNPDVAGELGELIVTPPVNPAPGTEYSGTVANVYDYFTVVFNEQIRTADSITVNAVHMFLEGPFAVGDMVIASSQCGVTSTLANQAPVANDDTYSTRAGQLLTVPAAGLLANDTDPEAGALVASKIPPTPPPTSGTSCAPYPAECAVWPSASDPAHGSLTLNADGSFTYTPDLCWSGVDSFVYTAADPRGKTDTATVTINVSSPTYFSIDDAWVTEGNAGTTTASFVVTRCGNTAAAGSVSYRTTNGTATAGSDYTAVPLTVLNFAAGETSKTVSATVTGDTAAENAETFNMVLSSPTGGAVLADTTGIGTIVNDDQLAYLSVADAVVTEGHSGTTTVNFTINRKGNTGGSSTVSYATANGTAVAGTDYNSIPLTSVTFAAGETAKTVSTTVIGDTVDEVNETFSLTLSAVSGAVIADTAGIATIVDDEGTVTPGPTTFFAVSDLWVKEGFTAAFTVTRSGNTAGTSSVKYNTTNGTAIGGLASDPNADYVTVPLTTLSFAAGETTKTVNVSTKGDTVTEGDEAFRLTLSAPVGGTLSDNSGNATIVNDDFASFRVNDLTVTEGNSGTMTAVFYVTRSGNLSGPAVVKYATANATATAGTDYTALPLTTVFFDMGQSSKLVTVPITGDTTVEPNETFRLNLSAQTAGSILADNAGTATIANDD